MPKKTKISLSRLESFLKAQCDRLRTSMDAAEYKNYIIALLFLKRINDQRSYLDLRLREGDVIFFGSRYVTVNVTSRLARDLLAILPEAMRDVNDGTELLGRLRGRGINYLSREICEDLIENRADYPQIIERRRELERSDEVNRLLQGVR